MVPARNHVGSILENAIDWRREAVKVTSDISTVQGGADVIRPKANIERAAQKASYIAGEGM